jgi:hypothetical protein
MPTYLTPGIYYETADAERGLISVLRTDIAAFAGIAERGPLHAPTPVRSWEQFQSAFGAFLPGGYLAYTVKAFFENGGQTCYVVRVAADTAQTASGVLPDGNGHPTLKVTAQSSGTWGDGVAVRVSRSIPATTRTAKTPPQPSDRKSSLVETVVGFPVGSAVRVFQDGAPLPLVTYRQVTTADAARGALWWDAPLDAAYDLTQPITFETLGFDLSVSERGRLKEVFADLSLTAAHPRYVESVVNAESPLIQVEDQHSPSPFPQRLPDPESASLDHGVLRLAGGKDGLAALTVTDFIGDIGASERRGLRTLELVDEVSIVAVPDILIRPVPPVQYEPPPPPVVDECLPCKPPPPAPPLPPPPVEQPPEFTPEQIFAVQRALVAHCEAMRYRIALLEPPASGMDVGAIQGWRQRFDSKYAALSYPWTVVYDPLRSGGRVVRAIPPSGHVAGIYAQTDIAVGVHKAPANTELLWAQDATAQVDADLQGLLNPQGINCIRAFPGRGLRLYGARTVSSDPSWRYVNVRRLLMMIEQAVEVATQWAVFEPNDFFLRQTLLLAISSFLESLWQGGALAGATADEAFFVKCDNDNNPPGTADLGRLIVDVGVAPSIPAEFVVFRIGRTQDTLEITEQ